MGRPLQSLIVFVLLLIGLNFLFGEFDYGVHISIVGSVVLTLVVWVILGALGGGKSRGS